MTSSPKTTFATTPKVQVSWGELIDKITILEIKEQRLKSPEAAANARRELAALVSFAQEILSQQPDLAALKEHLKSVNEALWDIEDKIRAKEASKLFDQQFIELARSVYVNNDKRGDLKRQINALLNSRLVEEKQYTPYST
jgi:Family of unknown function (DUF6165)